MAGHEPRFAEKTVLHSPIVTHVFPRFAVDVAKKFRGLPPGALDESDQYLVPREDSQLDAFSDDDDLLLPTGAAPPPEEPPAARLAEITVLAKVTSIRVNGVEFAVAAPIRAACVLKGAHSDGGRGEDALLLSLKLGFLLLVRVFHVPAACSDKYYQEPATPSRRIYKPFIVQWWDTGSQHKAPTLTSSGHLLHAHASGLTVVSAAASGVLRIHNLEPTAGGAALGPHTNVPVDGVILQACFAPPLADCANRNRVMFLALVYTNNRRMELCLYEWAANEPRASLHCTTLPLHNTFPVPVAVAPLRNNASFVFVTASELILVSIHQIMSVEYDFVRFPLKMKGAFPTAVHLPQAPIAALGGDEVVILTDSGYLYLVHVEGNAVTTRAIAHIDRPISTFAVEPLEGALHLVYGCDTRLSQEVRVRRLLTAEEAASDRYSKVDVLCDHANWAPVVDVQIIDAYRLRTLPSHADHEAWALTGAGKRTKLTQLRHGYSAERKGYVFRDLRTAEAVYAHQGLRTVFVVSLPFLTRVFEYFDDAESVDDVLVELTGHEGPFGLLSSELTLFYAHTANTLIQVTSSSLVTVTVDPPLRHTIAGLILFAHLSEAVLLLVYEEEGQMKWLAAQQESICGQKLTSLADLATVLRGSLRSQPSMAKVINDGSRLLVAIGDFDGRIVLHSLDAEEVHTIRLDHNPYTTSGLEPEFAVPHDIVATTLNTETVLFIGSKDGYFISGSFDGSFVRDAFLRLSDTEVAFYPLLDLMCLVASRNLWMVNLDESRFPQMVFFNESTDRATMSVAQLDITNDHTAAKPFGFLREDGFSVGLIHTNRMPNTKLVSLGCPALRLMYIDFMAIFVALCGSDDTKLRFVDRKLLKPLDHIEWDKNKVAHSIFLESEHPISICIWAIPRQDNRVSKKLLIGLRTDKYTGAMKVVDLTSHTTGKTPTLTVTELNAFEWKEPISCIQQLGSSIIFVSGTSIHTTGYNVNERKLNSVKTLMTLPSAIVSLACDQQSREVTVTTKSDSVFKFKHESIVGVETLTVIARDPSPKSLVNAAQIDSGEVVVADKLHSSVVVFTETDDNLNKALNFKVAGVPRVYAGGFRPVWERNLIDNDDEEVTIFKQTDHVHDSNRIKANTVICVGVNGEITSLHKVSHTDHLSDHSELNLPFEEKVNGKGLFALNKPYFRYRENFPVLDLDVEGTSNECSDMML